MVAGVCGALLLAILAGSMLARTFSKRFADYIEQSGAIASGDYDRPWPTSRIVEFADLANDLQRMSDAIRQREQAMLASEARFRDRSAMASDWFWEQDEQFRFTYFSTGDATLCLEPVSYTHLDVYKRQGRDIDLFHGCLLAVQVQCTVSAGRASNQPNEP